MLGDKVFFRQIALSDDKNSIILLPNLREWFRI